MIVELAPHEIRNAVLVGVGRELAAQSQRRRHLFPARCGGLSCHIVGALAELAVAKAFGIYWTPNVGGNDHGTGDVEAFQVRASVQSDALLPIRDHDAEGDAFVFVTGEPPCLTIRGWIWGREGMRDDWRCAPNGGPPAWMVPQSALRPFDELVRA